MIKKFTSIIFALIISTQSTFALFNSVEKDLFEHILLFTKKAVAKAGLQVYPWSSCYDLDKNDDNSLFLSRPVFEQDQIDPAEQTGIFKWIASLLSVIKEKKIKRLICAYEIDHFARCQRQSVFTLELDDDFRPKFFEPIYEQEVCKS